jgi:enoyl-CoA hydratase
LPAGGRGGAAPPPARAAATLNRPDKRNAIDQATIDALHALCDELEAEPRTLILTGTDGVFASGADIAQLRERRAADALAGINANAFVRVNELPMPVIAAVDGWALGGGAELAYAADIRIATPDAKFGNPETGLGIIPAAGATWRLREIIGEARAAELLLTGRIIDAAEAVFAAPVLGRIREAGNFERLLDLVQQFLLVAEVPVQGRRFHAELGGQATHAQRVETDLVE